MMNQKGFLILEVLMAVLVIAVCFAAFMAAMAQALKVSSRANETTDALSEFETLIFEIESGIRSDLASYGGKGDLKSFRYAIEAKEEGDFGLRLKNRLSWKDQKEFIEVKLSVLRASVQ